MSSFRSSVLEKIQTESAFDTYCKFHSRPPLPLFYLDALDQPIQSWNETNEIDSSVSSAFPHAPPSTFVTGSIIDLQGPSASGKSSFLLHILSTYIAPPYVDLPNQYRIAMYGLGLHVLFMDTDFRFDPVRLQTMLANHFGRCLSSNEYPETLIPELVQSSLQRLLLATPHDPATFVQVFQHFLQAPWKAPRVHLILMDSFSQLISPFKQCTGYDLDSVLGNLHNCFLQAKLLGITCVQTSWKSFSSSSELGPKFSPLIDIQFTLQAIPRTKEPDATAVECTLTFPKLMAPRYVGIHTEGLYDLSAKPPLDNAADD